MHLPDCFIHWIRLCISTTTFSISVNGEPAGYFPSSRGIRQGCALSPYLYVIVSNVLSKLLNNAASSGIFGYHPRCADTGLTHLSFADDILVFTDGTPASLEGVLSVLDVFGNASGLRVNALKSSIFTTANPLPCLVSFIADLGLRLEPLPVRYLGLPLTTKKLSRADYAPLLDRLRSKMTSWATKLLSYAGRLQLIKSVIVSTVNFWQAAFRLPWWCIQEINSLCSNFLWSGSPTKSHCSKLSWEEVCRPKEAGGLDIRRLEDTSQVFSLSIIWRLLSGAPSVWATWVRQHLLRDRSFWDVSPSTQSSWIWRKLLQCRPVAAAFFRISLRDGIRSSFWFDDWSSLGPLISIAGDRGIREFGIPRNANVASAARDVSWRIRRPRIPSLRNLHTQLLGQPPPDPCLGSDVPLWKHNDDDYRPGFSSARTWQQLRPSYPSQSWFRTIWFPQSVPRYAFISWLAVIDRLQTGQRMRAWGIYQPCLLCGEPDETRDHLFFACPYSFTLWSELTQPLLQHHLDPCWHATLTSLRHPTHLRIDKALLRLALQATIYNLWRERNHRRHASPPHSPSHLRRQIVTTITNRIISLQYGTSSPYHLLLNRWQAIHNH